MKTAIALLFSLSVGTCSQWDPPRPVLDTPEVAAAKSAHLSAFARASSPTNAWTREGAEDDGSWKDDGSWRQYDDGSWKDDTHVWNQGSEHQWDHQDNKWTGPVALPPGYDKNGAPLQVQDTPEVEAAKSKHFQIYAHVAAKSGGSHVAPLWASPSPAGPIFLNHGLGPQDTPEVIAAKAAHFAAHAERRH